MSLELDEETRRLLDYGSAIDREDCPWAFNPNRKRVSRAKAKVVKPPAPPKFDGRHRRNWRHRRQAKQE